MIDIRRSSDESFSRSNPRGVLLLVALCFVVWDSGYLSTLISRYNRVDQSSDVDAVLLIKCDDMTDDQKYTAASPVLDEIADRCGINFRVISSDPGDLSASPMWVQELFAQHRKQSPCLAVLYLDDNSEVYPAPESVSDFKNRLGAR